MTQLTTLRRAGAVDERDGGVAATPPALTVSPRETSDRPKPARAVESARVASARALAAAATALPVAAAVAVAMVGAGKRTAVAAGSSTLLIHLLLLQVRGADSAVASSRAVATAQAKSVMHGAPQPAHSTVSPSGWVTEYAYSLPPECLLKEGEAFEKEPLPSSQSSFSYASGLCFPC